MSPIAKFVIEQTDENVSVNLMTLARNMSEAGFDWRHAKMICLFLGIGIQGGS